MTNQSVSYFTVPPRAHPTPPPALRVSHATVCRQSTVRGRARGVRRAPGDPDPGVRHVSSRTPSPNVDRSTRSRGGLLNSLPACRVVSLSLFALYC